MSIMVIGRLSMLFCAAVVIACGANQSGPRSSPAPDVAVPHEAPVTLTIRWSQFSVEALQEAARHDLPVFVYLHASWCDWCVKMEHGTLDDRLIVSLVNERFMPMIINVSASETSFIDDSVVPPRAVSGAAVARWFNVTSIPSGRIIAPSRQGGWHDPIVVDAFTGYMTQHQMLSWLSGAAAKAQDPPR